MGLLALGTPLNWEETKPLAEHIRYHGITQFLNTWNRWKDITGKGLLWGDEVSLAFRRAVLMVDRIYGSLI